MLFSVDLLAVVEDSNSDKPSHDIGGMSLPRHNVFRLILHVPTTYSSVWLEQATRIGNINPLSYGLH